MSGVRPHVYVANKRIIWMRGDSRLMILTSFRKLCLTLPGFWLQERRKILCANCLPSVVSCAVSTIAFPPTPSCLTCLKDNTSSSLISKCWPSRISVNMSQGLGQALFILLSVVTCQPILDNSTLYEVSYIETGSFILSPGARLSLSQNPPLQASRTCSCQVGP